MIKFRDMPISRKLMIVLFAITSAALLLAGIGVIVADSLTFYDYLQRDLATFARIIGDNSTAALAFDDPKAAGETLSALRSRTHVVAAVLYRADGSVFSSYRRAGQNPPLPPPRTKEGVESQNGILTVTRPLFLADRRVGTLELAYDLAEMYGRVRWDVIVVFSVLLIASFVAYLLSSRLRQMIANPILELRQVASSVSRTRDYSIRARRTSGDEIGELADAFNDMLQGIEHRDVELRKAIEAQRDALARLAELNGDLQRANENLARSNADLERFAFIASHDLQEPLRMITVYSQLLIGHIKNPDEHTKMFVEQITGGTRRMRDLLADLLAYAEIAARPDRHTERVNLNVVIDKVLENLKISIDESGAVITREPLPLIRAQSGHFMPLFQNLISNSIKYRAQDPPRIHISASVTGGDIRIEVADNGIGIAPEYHNQIFVPFKRLHGKSIPGTGIGLAICQRVVERYGGRIWVESELNRGARFVFTLPAEIREAQEHTKQEGEAASG